MTKGRNGKSPKGSLLTTPMLLPLAKKRTAVTQPLESDAEAPRTMFGLDRNEAPLVGDARLTLGGTLV